MAQYQAVNVNTGVAENAAPKYSIYDTTELWIATIPSTYANADAVLGPVIPAGVWVTDLVIDIDKIDSNATPAVTFEVGYQNSSTTLAAAFVASGNTTAQAGGVVIPNVAATYGFNPTLNSTVILTITHAAGTGLAGKVRFKVTYNPNP